MARKASKYARPSAEIEDAAKAFESWVRFRRDIRSGFSDMIHSWTIALRNAVEPKDDRWHEREKEWACHLEKIGKDGNEVYSHCLGRIALASHSEHGDWLGMLYQRLSANLTGMGQFFTPYEISRLNASLIMDQDSLHKNIASSGYVSVYEPACGSGGMIIAAAERVRELGYDPAINIRAFGGDIDRTCVEMTYVQCRLQNIACWVQQADALDPTSGDRFSYRLATPAFVEQITAERPRMPEAAKAA